MKIIDEGEEGSRDGKTDPGVAVGGLSTEKVMRSWAVLLPCTFRKGRTGRVKVKPRQYRVERRYCRYRRRERWRSDEHFWICLCFASVERTRLEELPFDARQDS